MRPDGYVRVGELLQRPKLRELSFEALQDIVKNDAKSRYSLVLEADPQTGEESWWIRANQGHSLKASHDHRVSTAFHGTTRKAWESIKEQGLSKMTRNHIHLAQGVAGSGVVSGMRNSSQILIYVDVQKAIDAGIKFCISANGVVLTEGDERGFLAPQFFSRVETADGKPLAGWDGPRSPLNIDAARTVEAGVGSAPAMTSVGVGPSKKEEAIQASTDADAQVQDVEKKLENATL
ncbi:hypothetical protein ACG7TL_005238 [Trametes sanguinea]